MGERGAGGEAPAKLLMALYGAMAALAALGLLGTELGFLFWSRVALLLLAVACFVLAWRKPSVLGRPLGPLHPRHSDGEGQRSAPW